MHVRFMQKVDYYAGIPLCFGFTLFDRIKKLIFPETVVQIKSILFIELSEMGSAILAYPTIKKAISKVGKENVYFLIFKANKESVEVLNCLPEENIITIDSSSFPTFAISGIKALLKIRKLNISACLDLELFSRCTAMMSYISGARLRAGYYNYTEEGLYRGELLTHKVYYNAGLHMSYNFLALFDSLYDTRNELPLIKKKIILEDGSIPVYQPKQADLDNMKALLEKNKIEVDKHKLFILNPDPGLLSLRGWPKENFAELAKLLLLKDPDNRVAVVGLKHSKEYFLFISNHCQDVRILDFTGQTANLKELLALLSYSSCLITNDSGPAHMAALTRTKSLVLFGPETPVRYAPLGDSSTSIFAGIACSPCFSAANHRHSVCTNNVCMQEITVSEVYSKL